MCVYDTCLPRSTSLNIGLVLQSASLVSKSFFIRRMLFFCASLFDTLAGNDGIQAAASYQSSDLSILESDGFYMIIAPVHDTI